MQQPQPDRDLIIRNQIKSFLFLISNNKQDWQKYYTRENLDKSIRKLNEPRCDLFTKVIQNHLDKNK